MGYTPLWGTSRSVFAAISMEKTALAGFLTPDLGFTPCELVPENEHPVVYMLNRQKIRIFLPFLIMHYWEMIPLIPYVHFKDKPDKPYQTSPILYVSSWMIVLGARIMWHLNKVCARFDVAPPMKQLPTVKHLSAQVFRKTTKAITLTAEISGSSGAPSSFPNAETLSRLLSSDALIVSYASDAGKQNRYWTAAYQFKMQEVQPCSARIDVLDIVGLPKATFSVPPITDAVLGAFRVDFSWKLPWPGAYKPKA